MTEDELECFRLRVEPAAGGGQNVRRRRYRKAPFLMGPVPLLAIHTAARLPGKALAVLMAAYFRSGLTRQRRVTMTTALLEGFGVDRHARYRALAALREAGLLVVETRHGKNPVVTIPLEENE